MILFFSKNILQKRNLHRAFFNHQQKHKLKRKQITARKDKKEKVNLKKSVLCVNEFTAYARPVQC